MDNKKEIRTECLNYIYIFTFMYDAEAIPKKSERFRELLPSNQGGFAFFRIYKSVVISGSGIYALMLRKAYIFK